MKDEFKKELEQLINRHSIDNICQTPDFILADLVCANLWTMASVTQRREDWFGRTPQAPPLELTPTKGEVSNKAMTKEARRREFWIFEQKDKTKQTPYPTCYRGEPKWGCEPLPKDDPHAEIIHTVEIKPNEKIFSREEIQNAIYKYSELYEFDGELVSVCDNKKMLDELFPQRSDV